MDYKLKKLKLNKKLILSLVSLIIIVILSIALSINSVFNKKFEQYIIRNNENEISNIIDSIRSKYVNGEWELSSIQQIGEDAISNGIFVDLYDKDSNLVWGAMTYNKNMCHMVMGSIENNMNYMINKNKSNYTEKLFEIKNLDNEIIGNIKIGSYGLLYYMDNDVDFLKEINKVITSIGIVMVLITIFIAILISNNISKPVEVVSNMANLIGDGDYDNKIDYDSNIVEIDVLIKSINNLSAKLEEQENLRKRLTTDISHELRTPLNVLSSINQLIKEFTKKDNFITPEKLSYYMGIMDRNCSRLLSLINNLIDHTKIENNSYIINKKDEDIVYLVEETVLDMKDYIEEKGLELIFDTDVEEKVIRCDKVDIERCIINLVGNAVKFTPEGGLIEVLLQDLDDKVKIIVKDNGIGISEENQKIIFDRFNQVVDESSEQKGGSGLGLTITKQFITLHNGEIYVESEVGVGSEFIIILPVYSS